MGTNGRCRAVIAGYGVLTPIGLSPEAVWASLRSNATGIRRIQAFDASPLPCHIGGEIPDFVAKNLIEKNYRKSLNAMSRTVQLGVIAAQFAMQNMGLAKGSVAPERFGIEFASVMAATDLTDLARMSLKCTTGLHDPVDMEAYGRDALPEMPPMWMLKYLPNMPACHATILYDIQGPSNTLISNDAAGVEAIGEALRILRRGAADFMLVGGSESKINPVSLSRFNSFAALTPDDSDPTKSVRPFDAKATGACMGEGGVAFGLETLEHAKARGAKIVGEVAGYSSGMDRGHKGPGLARIIRNALADAGITPADVDHVNAHGLAVPKFDAFEARGIAEVFGRDVPVFAPLSRFGNMGAASGAAELLCSLLALQHGELPGTLNHDHPFPGCPISVHTGEPRPVTKPYAVKTSYTDLGQCAVAVVKKWEE